MRLNLLSNICFCCPSLYITANFFHFTATPKVSGATLSEALAKWYLYGDTVQLVDTCHYVNCNSGCGAGGIGGRSKERPPSDEGERATSFRKHFGVKL